MKKIFIILISLSVFLALTACGKNIENVLPTGGIGTEMETTTPSGSNTETTIPVHIHEYADKTIAATCTEDGYTSHICACGDSFTDSKTAATGHSFGEWYTTKEPTTSENGSAERQCTNCDEKETKVLGKLIDNHQHNYTSVITTPPTCTAAGTTTFSCSCGDTYTEPISKLSHNYSDIITNPTCTDGGYTTHTCSVCGDSFRDSNTNALGHSWTNATCTTPKSCSLCSLTDGSATGHNWNTATCTTPKTCSKCEKTEGTALGHSWNAATCTMPKSCSKCGKAEGSATGHNWSDATCTTPKTCIRCNATEGNATGHSWDAASCTTPKTCSKCRITEGSPTPHSWCEATCTTPKMCSQCGRKEGSATGHNWTDATCTTPKTCSKCATTEGDAIGHKYSGGKCTVCNKIQPYYRTEKLLDDYMGVKIYYTGIDQYSNLFYIHLRIENTTDEFVTIQIRDEKVNGHSNIVACSEDVAPNQTKTTSILVVAFSGSPSLHDFGEDVVKYIEFNFHVIFSERTEDKYYTSPNRIVLYPYQ